MANENDGKGGIFQWVRLFFDRTSGEKVKEDIKKALEQGTDPKKPKENVKEIGGSLEMLGAIARRIGLIIGSVLSIRAILRATDESQSALAQLRATVQSTGGAAGFTVGQLKNLADEIQANSRFSSEAVQGGLSRLLGYTDVQGDSFIRATHAAVDMAQALRIDVAAAAERVGNALNYPSLALNSLTKQGFRFTEEQQRQIKAMEAAGDMAGAQAIILGELELAYKGSALAARNTLGGALDYLKNQFSSALVISSESSAGIASAITDIGDAIPDVRSKVDNFFRLLNELAINAAVNVEKIHLGWMKLDRFFTQFGAKFSEGARERLEELNEQIAISEALIPHLEKAAVELIAELGRPPTDGGLPAQLAGAVQGTEDLVTATEEEIAALKKGWELRTISNHEIMRALQLEQMYQAELARGNLSLEQRNALAGQLQILRGILPFQRDQPTPIEGAVDGLRRMHPAFVLGPDADERFIEDFKDGWLEDNELIVDAAETAAMAVERAWEDAFHAMIVEGKGVGAFMEGLLKGVASGGLLAIQEYAQGKVAVNIAEAIEQYARSLGWAFLNPGQAVASAASAKQHLLAAAAWGAIGGAAGAGARGLSGGGGSSFRSSDRVGSSADRLDRQPNEIHIHFDPLDPKDPRFQAVTTEAVRHGEERYGKDAKIFYHPANSA